MKLTKLEKEILTKALHNQTIENRNAPTWRPGVKAPLPAPPQETNQYPLPTALHEMSNQDYRAQFNPMEFLQQVRTLFGSEIVQARTNTLRPESFVRAGFIFAVGKVCLSRPAAQDIIEAWQQKAPWPSTGFLPDGAVVSPETV